MRRRCGLLWADTLNVVDGRVTLGFAGVTPVTPASPPVTDRVVPFCFRSPIHARVRLCMSGITPQLQAAARSAYRNLYRASASTFSGE